MVRKVPLTGAQAGPGLNLIQVGGTAQTGRDIVPDIRGLADSSVVGLLRSIGDAGASPANIPGKTVLYLLDYLYGSLADPAETYTTTPLGASATYTSASKDYGGRVRVGFMGSLAFADQASATDGYCIQQSIDGSNWDLNSGAQTVSASVGAGVKVAVVARYVRVRYTNGGTLQTVFRLGGRYMIA